MERGTFFEEIQDMQNRGALKNVFPEIFKMIGVQQPPKNHQEGDVFQHTVLVLKHAPPTIEGQLAALLHDIGKTLGKNVVTGKGWYPMHGPLGLLIAKPFLDRFALPEILKVRILKLVCHHHIVHELRILPEGEYLLKLLQPINNDLLESLLALGRADELGHLPQSNYVPAIKIHLIKHKLLIA